MPPPRLNIGAMPFLSTYLLRYDIKTHHNQLHSVEDMSSLFRQPRITTFLTRLRRFYNSNTPENETGSLRITIQ